MQWTRHQRRRRFGFTMVELMVSIGVLGVVSLYLTDMLLRQSRAYTVVDHVTEIQQNSRAIADLLEREARVTGFLTPDGSAVCGFDSQNQADFLFVTDSNSLSFDDDDVQSYELGAPITAGFTGVGTETLTLGVSISGSDAVVLDDDEFYDTDIPPDGLPDSDFRPGAGVIVMDSSNPNRGTACGVIPLGPPSPIAAGSVSNVDFSLGGLVGTQALQPWAAGSTAPTLVAIPAHVYTVNANNQLLRDSRVVAEDVEDFQVAYFLDLDDDDVLDLPQEYLGATAAFPYDPTGISHDLLREIRINFVVRSRAQDPDFQLAAAGVFQPTENRVPPAGNDGFRRRVYTATVRPRNVGTRTLGGSP